MTARGAAMRSLGLGLGMVLLAGAAARGNDTAAVLGAGGLSFTTSADIAMASEDLFLSPSQVRVSYGFRNDSDRDIATTVAFPLPDIDQNENGLLLFLPFPDQENVVGFTVSVEGRKIAPKLEEKAVAADGRDVTAELLAAGVPLNARRAGWSQTLRALPPEVLRRLLARELIYADDPDAVPATDYYATWILKSAFHWEQTFPAGRTLRVDHAYTPITGGVSTFADVAQFAHYKDYCLDAPGKAGVRRLLKRVQAAAPDPVDPFRIFPRELSYVLTTGANWKGPIGHFRLIIDKAVPDAILSLCMEGLAKTGPTTFELTRENFTPKADIRMVIFTPEGK